eukprot:9487441-Pyramimonas_sp.AAC.4
MAIAPASITPADTLGDNFETVQDRRPMHMPTRVAIRGSARMPDVQIVIESPRTVDCAQLGG